MAYFGLKSGAHPYREFRGVTPWGGDNGTFRLTVVMMTSFGFAGRKIWAVFWINQSYSDQLLADYTGPQVAKANESGQ